MVGATTHSSQMTKVKKGEGTTSWPAMPQPGAHQQALADDSGHITYDVDTAKSAQEHLLRNLMLVEDTPITIEAMCYALLCTAETSRVTAAL